MTDFLSSLSERAVGLAPVLERRRPSLFEPVPGSAPLDHRHDDAAFRETTTEVVSEKRTNLRQSPGQVGPPADSNANDGWRLSRNRRRDTIRKENSSTQPNALSENRANRRAEESPSTLIVEKRVEAAAREDPRPSWRDRQVPIGPKEMNQQSRVVETRIEKEIVRAPQTKEKEFAPKSKDKRNETSSRQEPAPVMPAVRRYRAKADVKTEVETRAEKKIEPLVPRHDFKPSPITRSPQFAVPRVPSRWPPASKLNTPPAPPTIEVRIGRVEVRATNAAEPAKSATSSAKPTLSLEDYLQARSGGRR